MWLPQEGDLGGESLFGDGGSMLVCDEFLGPLRAEGGSDPGETSRF